MPGLGNEMRSALVLINQLTSVANDVDNLLASTKNRSVRGSLYLAKSVLADGRSKVIEAAARKSPWARDLLSVQTRSKNGPNCGTGAGGFQSGNDCAAGERRGGSGRRSGGGESGSSGAGGSSSAGRPKYSGKSETAWENTPRPELLQDMKRAFGENYLQSMTAASGIPDGSDIKIEAQSKSKVLFTATNAEHGIKMSRGFSFNKGKLYAMTNMGFEVSPENRGKGLYAESLLQQVKSASAKGIGRIYADGMRKDGDASYYTMARLGFDAEIVDMMFLKPETVSKIESDFPDAQYLSDIMKTRKGRKMWKEMGGYYHAEFDTSPQSEGRKRLTRYVSAKRRSTQRSGE